MPQTRHTGNCVAADPGRVVRRLGIAASLILVASLGGGSVRARSAPPLAPYPPDRHGYGSMPVAPRQAAGTLIAHIRAGRRVALRPSPNGRAIAWLTSRTGFGSPQTLAVTRALPGRRYAVVSTALPNGRVGWIDARAGMLRLSRTRVTVDVDLSRRVLRVLVGARVVRSVPVGIGAPGAPTPTGRFAVTDKLDGAAYSPVYGCCILALSAHQTHLPNGWTGGDRIAIHGGSTAGAISNGCLHAPTAALRYLMRSVPLGARVVIHP
jgi:L,D-transpeptidase catalytic domain